MRRIFPKFSPSEDVDRELRHHLEESVRELVAAGWEASAAREEALRRFGDVERVAGQCREIARRQAREERRSRMLEALGQDVPGAFAGGAFLLHRPDDRHPPPLGNLDLGSGRGKGAQRPLGVDRAPAVQDISFPADR